MADRTTEILLDALKQALAEPAEQRLYRSGKLAGLFPGRTGAGGEAAARALRDGLLEIVRTEAKGKTTVEWVRPTPCGVEFVREHESPIRALQELRVALEATQGSVPAWLADMRRDLEALSTRLTEEAGRWTHRLDALSARVEEALRRQEAGPPAAANGTAAAAPWAVALLTYLDRRRETGVGGPCPLPELFAALRREHPDLSITAFHEGLRRLHDRRAVRLVPFAGPPAELPEPEYALLEWAAVYYAVDR